MKHSLKRILEQTVLASVVFVALSATVPAHAARTTTGPYEDLKAEVAPSELINGGWLVTHTMGYFYPDANGNATTQSCSSPKPECVEGWIRDQIAWSSSDPGPVSPYRVLGVSYITSDDAVSRDSLRFTTVYGLDLKPDSEGLAMTGFNRRAPQLEFHSEQVFGKDGAVYNADFSKFVPIANLKKVLGPSFDLSPFQGDPSSSVYVFRTTIPSSALVPVP